jgi:hypothetical protein
MAGKRKRLGDVVEFPTRKGLAYLHLSQKHQEVLTFGWFVRVLPHFFSSRPDDFTSLVAEPELFGQFFPFVKGYPTVANIPVPEFAKPFPILKLSNLQVPATEVYWRLFDGHEFRFTRYLPPSLVNAPLIELTAPDILQERIETDWTPADIVLVENIAPSGRKFVWADLPLESDYNKVWNEYETIFQYLEEKLGTD